MTSPAAGDPDFPRVVGFDMPSQDAAAAGEAGMAMVAILDVAPAREWTSVFARQVTQFRTDSTLSDIRLVGRTITFVGGADILRKLTPQINAFVHRVSRRLLQDRTLGLGDDSPAPARMPPPQADPSLALDLEAVRRIGGIPTILEAIVQATGMRFAAVARVTDVRWTACAVYDRIEFGLLPGQDLVLESTICNEIRQHGDAIVFDRASAHPVFAKHPTPAMYGFESYISIPILRPDGSFFGTLCALDPLPARLDDLTIETMRMFARMIGSELPDAASTRA